MTVLEIGDDYVVADESEYQNTMSADEDPDIQIPKVLSPVNRMVSGTEVIEEFADGSSRISTWNEEALVSLLRAGTIEEKTHVQPIDVKEFIRQTVSFPGEDVIATADSRLGITGTYELTIKTSLTSDEREAINDRFHIIEIYGFDADHFDKNPQDESSLGLILDTNTYMG